LKYIEEALGSDPKDRLSTPEVAALPALFDVCTDGIDNDRDGLIDGEELDCDFGSCVDFDAATECDPF
jgi:hypothetical protein